MHYRLNQELWKDMHLPTIFLKDVENTFEKDQLFSEKQMEVKEW